MSSEPTDDAVGQFMAIANSTRDKAIAFLKANNLDPNRAIDSFFENPDGPGPAVSNYQSQGWPATTSAGPVFDTDADNTRYGVAPSRPPSRIGPRERQEEVNMPDAVEMPAEPAPKKTQQMSAAEREEHEMQQAVAMSLSDTPERFEQETGVIGADGSSKFGPANRDHYDEQNWALTLPFAHARETCVDPDPGERKREDDQPAFLRPSEEDPDHLSGLVTILHAIPLAREALLVRNRIALDYGYGPQWWNGDAITLDNPRFPSAADRPNAKIDTILETQRLMAFLDRTNRAFGSTDALAAIRTIGSWGVKAQVSRYMEACDFLSAQCEDLPARVFSSQAVKRSSTDEEPDSNDFMVADFTLGYGQETLYDVIDTNLWADMQGAAELDDVWLDHIGEVFVVRLNGSEPNSPTGIKAPAAFYPDRYLGSHKEYATEFRKLRLETEKEVESLQTLIYKLSDGTSSNGAAKFKDMMEKAITGSRVALKGDGSTADAQQTTQANLEQFAGKLRGIAEQVEQKLQALEKRKEEALESLKDFSRRLTSPSTSSPDDQPQHRYTLRGVCTLPHVTYVLKQSRENKGDRMDSNSGSDGWQWWRISFSAEDAAAHLAEANRQPVVPSSVQDHTVHEPKKRRIPIPENTDILGYTIHRVREVEVLRAAKEESSNVVLVYASDNAVNFAENALPQPLQAFVDTDNEVFEQELQDAENQQSGQELQTEMPDAHAQPTTGTPSHLSQDTEMQDSGGLTDRSSISPPINQPSTPEATMAPMADQSGQKQEMQERSGRGLMTPAARHRSGGSSEPMQRIQEEESADTELVDIGLEQRFDHTT